MTLDRYLLNKQLLYISITDNKRECCLPQKTDMLYKHILHYCYNYINDLSQCCIESGTSKDIDCKQTVAILSNAFIYILVSQRGL